MSIPKIERFGDKACKFTLVSGDLTESWYFSYDDCVAYEQHDRSLEPNIGHVYVRTIPKSATSEKHFRFMGCDGFAVRSQPDFEKIAGAAP